MMDFNVYLELLTEWAARSNLVGPSALQNFWLRHAYDSAQLLDIAPQRRVWADIGAGAGFPGIVLAILLKGKPGALVHLIDSSAKRTRFLQHVVSDLQLPAIVHLNRAEDLARPSGLEVVTARACAPLNRLLGYAQHFFMGETEAFFLKGGKVKAEIAEASKTWRFSYELYPSSSDPSGQIVQIKGLARE